MDVIIVTKLGKAYKQYPSEWLRLIDIFSPFAKRHYELKWVLKDLTFNIKQGETLGIVGMNGAGKSTLLKMVAGILQPSTGDIKIHGKVSALLELGMGFHPDFTGRQNVNLSGNLLGYGSKEMELLMPEIEEFSEIGEYLDKPIKFYSSGMQMRLAFSIATVKRPDILIVDEALSVGDVYFQHKSFSRIRKFRDQGTTILMVSHDKSVIQSICDRVILLESGCLKKDGPPDLVMDYYNASLANKTNTNITQQSDKDGRFKTQSGSGEVKIKTVEILNENKVPIEFIEVGQKITLKISITAYENLPSIVLGYLIKDRLGQSVYGTNTYYLDQKISNLQKDNSYEYFFTFHANIGEGSYSISVGVHRDENHIDKNYDWQDLATTFNIINGAYKKFIGVNWLPPVLECNK
jgi:lipopolysaccharide transport system ATP-binding protein